MTTAATTDDVNLADIAPVGSRVSWAAIIAGAVIALAVYLVLTLLGTGIGLGVVDASDVNPGNFGTGAAIWAVLTTIVALFGGGWVTSQLTVGENKTEAVIHGIILWGVVLFMTLWLVGVGMRTGFGAMWGIASFTSTAADDVENWEAMANNAGISDQQIQQMKAEAKQTAENAPQAVKNAVNDPQNREAAIGYAQSATWYTLLGTLLSMAAAIFGALVGAGPTFQLLADRVAVRTS